MNNTAPNTLGRALRGFFADHLPSGTWSQSPDRAELS
jgi:hypothetical protein